MDDACQAEIYSFEGVQLHGVHHASEKASIGNDIEVGMINSSNSAMPKTFSAADRDVICVSGRYCEWPIIVLDVEGGC